MKLKKTDELSLMNLVDEMILEGKDDPGEFEQWVYVWSSNYESEIAKRYTI